MINAYGPTETTVCASMSGELGSGAGGEEGKKEEGRGRVPIGKPIWNTQVYVLDERLEPVPVGVVGEVYIGGEGLARGYLKLAWLTAERFVPHPFSAKAGARLYRTGDLVKYLSNGNIEFLRRADRQVKVRGFRIELGEIEAALCELPDVREAVALLSEDHPGGHQLIRVRAWPDIPERGPMLALALAGLAVAAFRADATLAGHMLGVGAVLPVLHIIEQCMAAMATIRQAVARLRPPRRA